MAKPDHTGKGYQDYLPSYLNSIHPGGQAIYLITIVLILIVLACLPVVSVQISVSGKGIVRPVQEKTRILASSSGIVVKVFVKEGDLIRKFDPLLQIGSEESRLNLVALSNELKEARDHASDLAGLTNKTLQLPSTRKFKREYDEFLNRVEYLEIMHSKSMRELSRHESLFRNGLISEKEYDDLVFAENRSRKEMESFRSQSLAGWQKEYHSEMDRVRELRMRIRNTKEKIRLTTVIAPATGSMIEFKGIFEGSAVQAGTVLGVLSPESNLIGEFYISSRNMAYLRKGQTVHLHMDAFNSREWGFIRGSIYEISSDCLIMDNQPVYRAKCRLEQNGLQLNNGYSAELKKGMTFQARCLVARRTLFQLLADKANNWLNPVLTSQDPGLLPH